MPRGRTARRGAALIEVLVAAVVLATAGTGLIALLGQTSRSLRDATTTELLVDSAGERLDRLMVLDRATLAGVNQVPSDGGWSVRLSQIAPSLFEAAVARSDTSMPLVTTTLYRPELSDVAP